LFKEGKMPDRLTPPGYQAVLIGSVGSIEQLDAFAPMEEGSAEGTLMLMRLDFAEFLTEETLAGIEQACFDARVEWWPGYGQIVFADVTRPSVYLAWQKGIAWMPVIIGILVVTMLPALLGGLIWLILPQEIKDLINMLIQMGMMMLVMWLMMSLIKPLTAPERPKRLEEARA
jgi:hypothetical protein